MTVTAEDLLLRLSQTLRTEIAPEVGDEYARTQAFMASVIAERLSRQVTVGAQHAAAEAEDLGALITELAPKLTDAPEAVRATFTRVGEERTIDSLAPLIEALYAWGPNDAAVVTALQLIRPRLRADIDRLMEIAR